ncbi:MAG: hypothetical protein J6Q39_03710 [Bacteroidales bacterium]|nr:hypothetical protein [Bacteroidales bacterium]
MNKNGTSNIICKLSDNNPSVLFKYKVNPNDAPYRVSGLEKLEYDGANHAYILTFGGTDFTVLLSEWDMYLLM